MLCIKLQTYLATCAGIGLQFYDTFEELLGRLIDSINSASRLLLRIHLPDKSLVGCIERNMRLRKRESTFQVGSKGARYSLAKLRPISDAQRSYGEFLHLNHLHVVLGW